jgi:hypothetical protein
MLVTTENANFEKANNAKKEAEKLMEKYKNSKDRIDMEKFIQAEDSMLKAIAELKIKG